VTSVVSLRTFANSSIVPIVVFADVQREYLTKPRLLAISEINRTLDNCRKALDHYETTEWIDATLPRKLGIGKNAGG